MSNDDGNAGVATALAVGETLVSFLLSMIHNMHVARKQDVRPPSFFNPYASCSNDVMEINIDEAKEQFSSIAQKCGGVVNAIQP